MEPVSIPIRVDWGTMMAAKVANALRPSRLVLFLFSTCGLGTGGALLYGQPILGSIGATLGAVALLRLGVMAASSALDTSARRRFTGTLTMGPDGVELARPDGTSEKHPWSWILAARIDGERLKLRLDVRGGRAWVFLSLARLADRNSVEQVRALLRDAGKLEA